MPKIFLKLTMMNGKTFFEEGMAEVKETVEEVKETVEEAEEAVEEVNEAEAAPEAETSPEA